MPWDLYALIHAFPLLKLLSHLCWRSRAKGILCIQIAPVCPRKVWCTQMSVNQFFVASTRSHRSIISRTNLPLCFIFAGFDDLAVETQILRDRGISGLVILTMLKNCKLTFLQSLSSNIEIVSLLWAFRDFLICLLVGCALSFLQLRVEQHLTFSTIKVRGLLSPFFTVLSDLYFPLRGYKHHFSC